MHGETVHTRAFLHLQLAHMRVEGLRITGEHVNKSTPSCPEETRKGLSGEEDLVTSGLILQSTWYLVPGQLFARP